MTVPVLGSAPWARRLVAVTVSAADVLHPDSDLRHVAAAATEVDVLVARVDRPATIRSAAPLDAPDYVEGVDPVVAGEAVPRPATLHLHHLDLRWRVQDADEPDLVAALSELVGFDPEDRVFCVAPVVGPDGGADAEVATVARAVRRVARVYGLPVLHYRRMPDDAGSAVGDPLLGAPGPGRTTAGV